MQTLSKLNFLNFFKYGFIVTPLFLVKESFYYRNKAYMQVQYTFFYCSPSNYCSLNFAIAKVVALFWYERQQRKVTKHFSLLLHFQLLQIVIVIAL